MGERLQFALPDLSEVRTRIAAAERALALIARSSCGNFTTGPGSCWSEYRDANAKFEADRWCDPCIALAGLTPEASPALWRANPGIEQDLDPIGPGSPATHSPPSDMDAELQRLRQALTVCHLAFTDPFVSSAWARAGEEASRASMNPEWTLAEAEAAHPLIARNVREALGMPIEEAADV